MNKYVKAVAVAMTFIGVCSAEVEVVGSSTVASIIGNKLEGVKLEPTSSGEGAMKLKEKIENGANMISLNSGGEAIFNKLAPTMRENLQLITLEKGKIVFIINKKNENVELKTEDQLSEILKNGGNWKDFGGKDAAIVIAAEDESGGLRSHMGLVITNFKSMKASEILAFVEQNPNAIGYIYVKNEVPTTVKALPGVKAKEVELSLIAEKKPTDAVEKVIKLIKAKFNVD